MHDRPRRPVVAATTVMTSEQTPKERFDT